MFSGVPKFRNFPVMVMCFRSSSSSSTSSSSSSSSSSSASSRERRKKRKKEKRKKKKKKHKKKLKKEKLSAAQDVGPVQGPSTVSTEKKQNGKFCSMLKMELIAKEDMI